MMENKKLIVSASPHIVDNSSTRRLMLNENSDAASAAFEVGYESPSQFSREYTRLFGAPPKRDIEGLRRKAEGIGRSADLAA